MIGGSRDLPNRLWLSRTGDLFNFDTGTGLDDEAIEFGLVSDQVNAIRGVFSGRHLQVFTSGAEWMVTGDPLTPASIQLNRQTRVGSPVDRMVPPVDVDGATIFAARSGPGVYEFAYTDVQQAYQANDLALVARHLVRDPVAMAYDQARAAAARGDGRRRAWRRSRSTAPSRSPPGPGRRPTAPSAPWPRSTARSGPRSSAPAPARLERFDAALALDAALTGVSATAPQDDLDAASTHLEGRSVGVLADGAPRDDGTRCTAARSCSIRRRPRVQVGPALRAM